MPVAALRSIVGKDHRIAFGTWTSVAAVDNVATGLKRVDSIMVCFQDDLIDDPMNVSAALGTVAGTVDIKTWKNTGGTDPTPAAATTFGKKVNWIAIGA